MSNDQSHLYGTARGVYVVPHDADGNIGDPERIGAVLRRLLNHRCRDRGAISKRHFGPRFDRRLLFTWETK
jgi:hypothetical protein